MKKYRIRLYVDTLIRKYVKIFILIICFLHITISPYHHITCLYGAFKDLRWGTRPAGMGGAFVAVADDANAPLWNPAGISQVGRQEGTFMYAKPYWGLENISLGFMYFGYVRPLPGNKSIGVSWTNFDGAGFYREDTISVTDARYLIVDNWYFAFGINIKYLNHKYYWDEEAETRTNDPVIEAGRSKDAFTFDMGILVKLKEKLSFGFSGKNITQPDVGLESEDKVPMELRGGFAYRLEKWKAIEDIIPAVDVSYRHQQWGDYYDKLDIHFGCEGWFIEKKYGVRTGINLEEVSLGGSFRQNLIDVLDMQMDYAFLWPLKISNNSGTHRISMSIKY
ncbi:MAG: type IX secretion system membrane protein PorP/SprF [Elusimicrobia bacterium]|nr:type IX secretion system membrane protein PorP/SprF [Elusimicrobiota bacterium]